MQIKFIVPGQPIAKGRPKFSSRGKFVKVYTPKKTVNFETLVGFAAIDAGVKKLNGILEVEINFFFQLSKSKYRKTKPVAAHPKMTKPDIDNCIKSVLDGLNNIAFSDDSSVWKVTACKWYAGQEENARTEIIIKEMDEVE